MAVAFMVDKVALGQVFLRIFRFSPVIIVPPVLIFIIYWLSYRKEKRVKAGKLKSVAVFFRKSGSCVWKKYNQLCLNGFRSKQTR